MESPSRTKANLLPFVTPPIPTASASNSSVSTTTTVTNLAGKNITLLQTCNVMRIRTWISQFPILIFFIGTYILSWFGAYLLVLPELLRGEPIPKMAGLEMFPLMLLGPAIMGIFLTKSLYGRKGVRDLFRNRYARLVNLKWYFFLLLPPAAISFVLFILSHMYKPVFTPHYFLIGFLFGIPAGVLEEIGWTGFAFPKLRKKFNFAPAACFLGFAWGLWHFPVIDFLGSATPHGDYLVPFFFIVYIGYGGDQGHYLSYLRAHGKHTTRAVVSRMFDWLFGGIGPTEDFGGARIIVVFCLCNLFMASDHPI